MARSLGDPTPIIACLISELPKATDDNLPHHEKCTANSWIAFRPHCLLLVAAILVCFAAPPIASGQLPKLSTKYLFALPNASAAPPIAPTRPGTPIATLIAKAIGHVISVVVGLKLERPWTPEGYLSTLEMSQQRSAIAAAVTRFKWRYQDKNLALLDLTPLPYVAVMADVDLIQRLDLDDQITSIELNGVGSGGLRQSVPLVNGPAAWSAGYTGSGQTVVIVDSGVDKNHPFLAGKVVAEACYSDAQAGPTSPNSLCPGGQTIVIGTGAAINCDVSIAGCSHGTHVAGIAAGSSGADAIWGLGKGANIISIQVNHKVTDPSACSPDPAPCARYYYTDLARALTHVYQDLATQFNIAAVNMSLESTDFYATRAVCYNAQPALRDAVNNLRAVVPVAIPVVGITGNYGTDPWYPQSKSALVMPGCIPGVIDVGASTKDDTVWPSSGSSPEFDLLAPGEGNALYPYITSSVPYGDPGYPYTGYHGTSMAAPHVAGALAILRQRSPLAPPDVLLNDLVTTGVPLTDPANGVTKPRINVLGAVNVSPGSPVAPSSLIARSTSSTSISVSWTQADFHGVDHFSVQRLETLGGVWTQIGSTTLTSYVDNAVASKTTHQYRVQAVGASGALSAPSNIDRATTVVHSDEPLIANGSAVKAVHVSELRDATNSIRAFAGRSSATWTDATLSGVVVKQVHIQEIRDRLGEALAPMGISVTYTDPTLTPGVTVIKAVHIEELRRNAK